jgi:2-oxoglutarate ferredoxin oxidoreductase subunit alpha
MTRLRAQKIAGIADDVPAQDVELGPTEGQLAVVGWGSTYGSLFKAVERSRAKGLEVSHIHLRHLWPFPRNLGDLLGRYDQVLVPELNTGQPGRPFRIADIEAAIVRLLETERSA